MDTDKTRFKNITDAIRSTLESAEIDYDFFEEKREFSFHVYGAAGKIEYPECMIKISDNGFFICVTQSLGFHFNGDNTVKKTIDEFICRANYGELDGYFYLDEKSGYYARIRRRGFVDCKSVIPPQSLIRVSIYRAAQMFERYAPGLFGVMFSDISARCAIEKCRISYKKYMANASREAAN